MTDDVKTKVSKATLDIAAKGHKAIFNVILKKEEGKQIRMPDEIGYETSKDLKEKMENQRKMLKHLSKLDNILVLTSDEQLIRDVNEMGGKIATHAIDITKGVYEITETQTLEDIVAGATIDELRLFVGELIALKSLTSNPCTWRFFRQAIKELEKILEDRSNA